MNNAQRLKTVAEIVQKRDPRHRYLCIIEPESEYLEGINLRLSDARHVYAIYGCTPTQLIFNDHYPHNYTVSIDDGIEYVVHTHFIGSLANLIIRGVPSYVSLAALSSERALNLMERDVAAEIVNLALDMFTTDPTDLPYNPRWQLLEDAESYAHRARRDFDNGYADNSAASAIKMLTRLAQVDCLDAKRPLPSFAQLMNDTPALSEAIKNPDWGRDHLEDSFLTAEKQITEIFRTYPEQLRTHPEDTVIGNKATSLALACCGIKWHPAK